MRFYQSVAYLPDYCPRNKGTASTLLSWGWGNSLSFSVTEKEKNPSNLERRNIYTWKKKKTKRIYTHAQKRHQLRHNRTHSKENNMQHITYCGSERNIVHHEKLTIHKQLAVFFSLWFLLCSGGCCSFESSPRDIDLDMIAGFLRTIFRFLRACSTLFACLPRIVVFDSGWWC